MSPSPSTVTERWTRQGLPHRLADGVVDAVRRTTAIQAQDTAASYLGVRARGAGLRRADVVRAVEIERTVVRTWLMRGTIHLVDTADLRWLVALVGPNVQRRYRARWRQLGLSDEFLDTSLAVLPAILAGGPLDRHQIRAALAEHGLVIEGPDPQLHVHVLVHACASGLLCRGPDRGRDSTFALIDDWVPGPPTGPTGEDALAELARRYFAAFSPATAADFTTWSGFASGRAIELLRDELTPVEVGARPGYRLGEAEPVGGLRLLPAFDNYVIGYRDRTAIVPADRHGAVYQGGMIRPVVVVDGQAVGTWRLDRVRGTVIAAPWRTLAPRELSRLSDEVADIAMFLDADLTVRIDQD